MENICRYIINMGETLIKRINTRQFQPRIGEQIDRTNIKRVNPLQVQNKIQDNQNKAVAHQILARRYPQAAGMDYEGLVNLDKSTTPVSFNGKVYVGGNYQPASYSQDNKSDQEHKQAQDAFIQNQEQQRKEDEIKQTAGLLNNPYNPIGWIPGLRSVVNAGADQNYSRTHNTAFTPYTADTALSTAGDAITLGFGLGPLNNYAGSYVGTVAGGLIGEQFDNPQLGQLFGGIVGGSSPKLITSIDPTRLITNTGPGKRLIETFLRTGDGAPNPLEEVQFRWPTVNYILFGKSPRLRKLFRVPMMHYGDNSWSATLGPNIYKPLYKGILGNKISFRKGYGDIVDAYLYGTPIDPRIAIPSKNNDGLEFFADYINDNGYSNRPLQQYDAISDIGVVDPSQYSNIDILGTSSFHDTPDNYFGGEDGPVFGNKYGTIDVGGHHRQYGLVNGRPVVRGFDIWKFNSKDYMKKWSSVMGLKKSPFKKWAISKGLDLVDKAGQPIIFKDTWKYFDPSTIYKPDVQYLYIKKQKEL